MKFIVAFVFIFSSLSNGIEHHLWPKQIAFLHVAYPGDGPIWIADHSRSFVVCFDVNASSAAPVTLFVQIQIVPWHVGQGQQW